MESYNYDSIAKVNEDEYEATKNFEEKFIIKISDLIAQKEQLETSIVEFNKEITRIDADILYLQNIE